MACGVDPRRSAPGGTSVTRSSAGLPSGAEQLLGPVGPHPVLKLPQMRRIGADLRQRHLVRAPRAFHRQPVDLRRAGPALRRPQHDHRPALAVRLAGFQLTRPVSAGPGLVLDAADPGNRRVERRCHLQMGNVAAIAGDIGGLVAVPAQQRVELAAGQPGQHRRISDLPAVEVQDRQDGTVAARVDEPVRVPAGGQRAGLGLPVADHARHDQVRVVERRAVRVRQRVAKLAALVNRSRRLRRDVARHPAGEGELAEQLPHPGRVALHAGIDVGIAALQPGVSQRRRAAMPRPDHDHHRHAVDLDRTAQVRPDEIQARRRTPVAQQPRLDLLRQQRTG